MAKFEMELPNDLIKQFEALNQNAEKIMGDMTEAGAKAVAQSIRIKCPDVLKNHIKISVTYKTPSDGSINTKVYFGGYVPFSSPSRKYFQSIVKGHSYSNPKECLHHSWQFYMNMAGAMLHFLNIHPCAPQLAISLL